MIIRRFGLVLALTALLTSTVLAGCGGLHPPPTLTPQARLAWGGLQLLPILDQVRDLAIGANTAGLLSVPMTRVIVQWHEQSLLLVRDLPKGWRTTLLDSIPAVQQRLSQTDRTRFDPYFSLLITILKDLP